MRALKRMAGQIADALIAEGFTIHRYDAQRTSSIYLKLDWGACNMVRISDHPGHAHGTARYNIGTWVSVAMEVCDPYPHYYYPPSDVSDLIAKCVEDRAMRRSLSGEAGYTETCEKKRKEAKRARSGFWTKARRIR